jgi:hypothetical protein
MENKEQSPWPVNAAVVDVNKGNWMNRLIIGHPMTGLVRVEWMMGRYGQTIPANGPHIDVIQFLSPYVPLCYQVADAENLIARTVIEQNAEWLLFWEHDNIPPNNALIELNQYMLAKEVPVIGGLYFTKSVPPEPLLYRGSGNSYFNDWRLGDKVWCSGVPFGFTLIHASIIKAMWEESPEYIVNGQVTRRVFEAPRSNWMDPEKGAYSSNAGTSDLAWCKRVVEGDYFTKAGWPKYKKKKHPFLIDTSLFVRHIDNNGVQWPLTVPERFRPNGKSRIIT